MANQALNTELVDKAILFAVKAHSGTERRGKGFPYIIHPMEAMEIVSTITADPELLTAAALHDTVEDTDVTLEVIRREFGNRVAELVEAESDVFMDGVSEENSWHIRKKAAIDRLASAPYDAKIVAMGDKLSNMRAIWRDYQIKGDELWNIFHAKDKKDHEWHYRGLAYSLAELSDTFAYKEFVRLIDDVFAPEAGQLNPELIDLSEYEQSGDGYTAVSYNHKDGKTMIKLYSSFIPKSVPEVELKHAFRIQALGVRVPMALRLVTDGERVGVEFERVVSKLSYSRSIANNPELLDPIVVRFALACKKLHSIPCDTTYFENVEDFFRGHIAKVKGLTDEEKARFEKLIASTPAADTCIHGDLHIGNIITNGVEDFWIDLGDFRYGNPLYDLGMLHFVCHGNPESITDNIFHLNNAQMENVWNVFVRTYFNVTTDEDVAEKTKLIAPYASLVAIHFASRESMNPVLRMHIDMGLEAMEQPTSF